MGDDDGRFPEDFREREQWVAENEHQTLEEYAYRYSEPKETLLLNDQLWFKEGSSLLVDVRPRTYRSSARPNDIEAVGVGPMAFSDEVHNSLGVPDAVADDGWESVEFASSDVGTLQRVSGELQAGDSTYRLEWDLDPAQGGQPVRSALYRDGAMMYQSVTRLQQIGDRWFPKSTEFYRADFKNGQQPHAVVEVTSASFDEPWHWQEPFTPNDIGVELGHQLTVQPGVPGTALGDSVPRSWDGARIIDYDQLIMLIHLRGIDPGPSVIAQQAKHMSTTPEAYLEYLRASDDVWRKRWEAEFGPYQPKSRTKSESEDDWDRYVRDFAAKHSLTGEKRETALRLLKHLKGLRDYHQDQNSEAIAKAEASGDNALAAKLNKPVDKMFAALKRGLLRLVPPSQRKPNPATDTPDGQAGG